MINVGIIGVSGFAGFELVKILSLHKQVNIEYIASRSLAGKKFCDVFPQYVNIFDKTIESISEERASSCDVVFLALPHTVSMDIVNILFGKTKIIDLSADFRLKSIKNYEKWYKKKHTSERFLKNAVYGLCELNKDEIQNSSLIANPGCYATSIILPLLPIIDKADARNIIADSKSGVSGAGRKLNETLQFCSVNENFKAYSVAAHRHTPEIEEVLSGVSQDNISITFSPHLLPVQRGILSTIYVNLKENLKTQDIFNIYNNFYKNRTFVRIKETLPQLNDVKGSNFCDIGFVLDKRNNRLVLVSVIDNLIKGASGQAVQNMNIMFKLKESEGLLPYPYYP